MLRIVTFILYTFNRFVPAFAILTEAALLTCIHYNIFQLQAITELLTVALPMNNQEQSSNYAP